MARKRACDLCYKKKIQCDFSEPSTACNWCHHHGLLCTFDRVRERKKRAKPKISPKPKAGSNRGLLERLERLEETLARTITYRTSTYSSSAVSESFGTLNSPTTTPLSSSHDELQQAPVNESEQVFVHETEQPHSMTIPFSGLVMGTPFDQIHYSGFHLGNLNSKNGMPMFSDAGKEWISSRTGVSLSGLRLYDEEAYQSLNPTLSVSYFVNSPTSPTDLPKREYAEKALEAYSGLAIRLAFPVIDRVIFTETMNKAYSPFDGYPSQEQVTAKACVLAFLAVMARFLPQEDLEFVDSKKCAAGVQALLPDVCECASITSIQALILLHVNQTFSGYLQSASMTLGIACRLVRMLGGHLYSPTKTFGAKATRDERNSYVLRMMFWLCYIFDKESSLRTGQPPLMADEDCDLTPPDDYMSCYPHLAAINPKNGPKPSVYDEMTPHLPGDLRLACVKSKAYRMLFSTEALKKSDAEVLRDIRELDEELENWRMSIPDAFRPALSIAETTSFPDMDLLRSMRHISLHLEYHHLLATIHRASGRCRLSTVDLPVVESDWNPGVHSSIALCLEASRSTLLYLKAAVHGLAGESFWVMVFYPTVAVLTLFCNILAFPLDPQARIDLDLLRSASELIKSMPLRQSTPYEIMHVNLVNEFVLEAIRLGSFAVSSNRRNIDPMMLDA